MYKQIRFPVDEYKGQNFENEEILVQPDQALSLQEILERFARDEQVEVGHPTFWDDDEDRDEDLEKLRNMDLVDKFQYLQSLRDIQEQFQDEEAQRLELAKKQEWEKQILEREKQKKDAQNGGSA